MYPHIMFKIRRRYFHMVMTSPESGFHIFIKKLFFSLPVLPVKPCVFLPCKEEVLHLSVHPDSQYLYMSPLLPAFFVIKRMIDQSPDQSIKYGKYRNSCNHSRNPKETAPDHDGNNNHKTGKSGRVSENFRTKDISIKLLKKQDKIAKYRPLWDLLLK